MGTAKFWYYPQPSGNQLVEIDLGEPLGELYSDYQINSSDGVALDGTIYRSNGKSCEIVTIQRDRMIGGEDTAIALIGLQNHLDRGYSCAFTADSDKAFAFPILTNPLSGSPTLNLGPNPFSAFMGTLTPSVNDYMMLETKGPGMITEAIKVDSVESSFTSSNGGTLTPVDAIKFNYDRYVFARWYRCFPVMKRPQGSIGTSIITNEHGFTFSLNVVLVNDVSGLMAFHPGATDQVFTDLIDAADSADNLGYEITGKVTLDRHIEFLNNQMVVSSPSDPYYDFTD